MSCTISLTFFLLIVSFVFEGGGADGEETLEDKRTNLLIPCHSSDALFLHGICLICIQPISSTHSQSSSYKTQDELDIQMNKRIHPRKELAELFYFSNNSSQNQTLLKDQKLEERLFGCLKNPAGLKQIKVLSGALYVRGQTVRIVTIERPPFVKIRNGKYSGVCFELVDAVKEKYNFTTQIFLPYDGNWGSKGKNGSFNGMVGQVIRKEAEMGVAGFSVTLQRAEVIDFTDSFHQEPSAILIPPPTEGEKLSVLIRPLTPLVWLSVLITVGVLCPTLYILHILSAKLSGDEEEIKKAKSCPTMIGDLLHFMIGSLLQESVLSPVNKYKTTRFLVILWWLLALVVANVYIGYLVSYLSAPKLSNLVDGLEDLLQQNKLKWTFRLNTAHQSLFKSETSSGTYKAIGDPVSESEMVTKDNDGVSKVLTGKFAFIKEKSFLDVALAEDFSKTQICRMTVARQKFFRVETALIVQKGSKILELFNFEILNTVSTGLMEKWKLLHWPREDWCNDAAKYIASTQPKTRKLALEDVQGAYFLFACGIFFSILAFLGEQILKSIFKSRSFQSNKISQNYPLFYTR